MSAYGQTKVPRVGSILHLDATDGGPSVRCRVVGKLWARGNRLIGLVVEDADHPGERAELVWPLEHL